MTSTPTDEGFFYKLKCDLARYDSMFKPKSFKFINTVQVFLFMPGFQFCCALRLQEVFGKLPFIGKLLRRILWYITCIYFGSDVLPTVSIGSGAFFPHPYGIVIGTDCVIGRNVSINQNVTLGRPNQQQNQADPIIHDNVKIYTGAVVIGAITIGENATIGANSVVTKDVPPGATAVGVPARCITPREASGS